MLNWKNTCPPKLKGEDEVTTMFEAARNITYELGFDYCGFAIHSHLHYRPGRDINLNNYPTEWNKIYKQENYIEIDPIVTHCKHSVLPLIWEEKTFARVPDMWVYAQSNGLRYGCAQSTHDFSRGVFSILNLGRREGTVQPEELYEKAAHVLWLCHALHAVVAQQAFSNDPYIDAPSKLTPRETEILKWAAMGKSAAETAAIVCVAERTVGFHISSAMRKLGVNNKIAAVITAVKAGLF